MSLSIRRNKNRMRPSKSAAERRRRMKVHRARLAALGVPPALLDKMPATELRTLLKRPKETARRFASAIALK
jgi:hypothetical protein